MHICSSASMWVESSFLHFLLLRHDPVVSQNRGQFEDSTLCWVVVATHMSVSKEAVAIIGSAQELEGKVFFLLSRLMQRKLTFLITVPPGIVSEMDAPLDDPFVTKGTELPRVLGCSCQPGEFSWEDFSWKADFSWEATPAAWFMEFLIQRAGNSCH